MSKRAEERINEMRTKLSNVGAIELTPNEGILLRADFNSEYKIEEERYVAFSIERRVFIWDLFPQGAQQ